MKSKTVEAVEYREWCQYKHNLKVRMAARYQSLADAAGRSGNKKKQLKFEAKARLELAQATKHLRKGDAVLDSVSPLTLELLKDQGR